MQFVFTVSEGVSPSRRDAVPAAGGWGFTVSERRCSDCWRMGFHRLGETLFRLLFRLEVFGEECIDGFEKQGTAQAFEFFGITFAIRI